MASSANRPSSKSSTGVKSSTSNPPTQSFMYLAETQSPSQSPQLHKSLSTPRSNKAAVAAVATGSREKENLIRRTSSYSSAASTASSSIHTAATNELISSERQPIQQGLDYFLPIFALRFFLLFFCVSFDSWLRHVRFTRST